MLERKIGSASYTAAFLMKIGFGLTLLSRCRLPITATAARSRIASVQSSLFQRAERYALALRCRSRPTLWVSDGGARMSDLNRGEVPPFTHPVE